MWGEFQIQNGVHLWGSIPGANPEAYLEVRRKEGRLLTDDQVRELPVLSNEHPLSEEWKMRKDTANRFRAYLKHQNFRSALEIGCGNGWFSETLAEAPGMEEVVGLDVNIPELEQAVRVFGSDKIRWICGDLFQWKADSIQFDLIVLNASIQYFPNMERLFKHCNRLLNTGGELHILDSPVYHIEQLVAARERTENYYRELGVPQMASSYFHHRWDQFKEFKIHYRPKRSLFQRLIRPNASPFPWLSIQQTSS